MMIPDMCERLAGASKWSEKGPGRLPGGAGTQLQHGTKTFAERWNGVGEGLISISTERHIKNCQYSVKTTKPKVL